MDEFIKVFFESVVTVTTSLYFLIFLGFVFVLILVLIYSYFSKREKKNYDFGISRNELEQVKELKQIKDAMNFGKQEKIKVDAVQAIYIAQHFDNYNLVGSDDGRVLFEKMKRLATIVDADDLKNELNIKITQEEREDELQFLAKEDGTIRIASSLGWTDYNKLGQIIGTKVLNASPAVPVKKQSAKNDSPAESKESKLEVLKKLESLDSEELTVNDSELLDTVPESNVNESKTQEIRETNKYKKEEQSLNENPIIDATKLANFVNGKEKKTTKIAYEPLYVFNNVQSFLNSNFLSEEGNFIDKISKFINFLSKHENIFYVSSEKKLYIHIDSLILTFARTIQEEYRKEFLLSLYTDDSVDFKKISSFLDKFSNKLEVYCDNTFITAWKPAQLDYRSVIFPRAIKKNNKIIKGEFAIFSFKLFDENVVLNLDEGVLGDYSVIGVSIDEYNAVEGKQLKIKSMMEIINVL